jgi:hypothetical protein
MAHPGGELDQVLAQTRTLFNGNSGLRFGLNWDGSVFQSLRLDVMGILGTGKSSLAEKLPFTKGWGEYSTLSAKMKDVHLKIAYWRSKKFINVLGNPIFCNVSNSLPWFTFPEMEVLNPGIQYEHAFGKGYYMGADLDLFYNLNTMKKSFNCSAGLYIRLNPSIVLK